MSNATNINILRPSMCPLRIQWIPNLIRSERRICLTRIRWERGAPGTGGYSAKLSISLCFMPEDFWIGVFWKRRTKNELTHRGTIYLCLFPMLPLRIKLIKTWGGIIP